MPKGILNHDIWRRAKSQVEGGKQYRDKWKVISHVYQQMGGKYHKSIEKGDDLMGKSIEAIQNLSKVSTEDMMRTISKQDHGESFDINKSAAIGRKLGSAAIKVGSKLRRGARALSAAGHSSSARAVEYAGKGAIKAGAGGLKHAGKVGAAAIGAAGLAGVAALGSGGKKTRKATLREINDISKGLVARGLAHGSRALRGISGRIGGAFERAGAAGIRRNMMRTGAVANAKQLRMLRMMEVGGNVGLSPTQSKGVMRGIARAPGKVARGIGRGIGRVAEGTWAGPYGGTRAALSGGAALAAGGLVGAYTLRSIGRSVGLAHRRGKKEGIGTGLRELTLSPKARKATLQEANDICKGISGVIGRGMRAAGMGIGRGLTAIGAKKAGNFAFRHPKVVAGAAVGGAGALGIGAMSRRRKQNQGGESQGQV